MAKNPWNGRLGYCIRVLNAACAELGIEASGSPYVMAKSLADRIGVEMDPSVSKQTRVIHLVTSISDQITARATPAREIVPLASDKTAFYRSWEWRTARMVAIKRHGRRCESCGATPGDLTSSGDPVRIVVDHIKPLGKRWDLRLDQNNLQVLCDECNMGKGAWDETDWRSAAAGSKKLAAAA